jgi:hypothetical protein
VTLAEFLSYAASSCVNGTSGKPILPSLEVDPEGICPKCGAGAALEDYCEECEESRR